MWTKALDIFLQAYSNTDIEIININYNNVRPEGERLKTFGGRASGHRPLKLMFEEIEDRIKNTLDGVIDPVTAMDIMNSIAKAIVVGGVRRSSQIVFGDVDDTKYIDAKKNLFFDSTKAKYKSTRVLSNNSIHLWQKPSWNKLVSIFDTIKNNGEPGLYIAENAAKRRPNYKGSNPCGEVLLDSNGVCNLTTTNLVNFVLSDGNWDKDKLFRVTKLSVRMGSRITLVDMWDKEWDYIQKRDRLLGVSLTGIVDAYNLLNDEAKKDFPNLIKQLKEISREEADKYHDELGIPRSLLVTTNKPEGSLSQLPTVSSGIHAPYSPYYYRRVRVSKTDPVSKALLDLGLKAVPENDQGDDINSDKCNTLVFTIPIKTSASIRAIDESAIEQLERYKLFITNYVEHTVSVTITVADDEWDDVTQWVWDNWEYCIGIAFLPRFDPSEADSPYPNMPYESITKKQYYDIELDEDKFIELISKYEMEHEEHELEYDCKTGCPVR